jgi:hypothetical protein
MDPVHKQIFDLVRTRLLLEFEAVMGYRFRMKTVKYTIQLDEHVFRQIQFEAERRDQSLDEVFKTAISAGLLSLDSAMEKVVADTWEKIGAPPEIDYDKI